MNRIFCFRLLFICLITSLSLTSWSQFTVNGTLLNAESDAVVPYCNIGIRELATGTVSNKDGDFVLSAPDEDQFITFSAIGYESLTLPWTTVEQEGTILLTPSSYILDSIQIVASKIKGEQQLYGEKNKKRGQSVGFGSSQVGTAIGAPIHFKEPTYVSSANFVLNHAKGDSMSFQVNIYQLENGSVGPSLLSQNITIREKQRKGTFAVDLSSYNLVLHETVLLTLQWIENDGDRGNQGLTFDTKKGSIARGVYLKSYSVGDFQVPDHLKEKVPCFYFMGSTY